MDKFGTHSVRYLRDKRGVTSGFVLLNEKRMDDVRACGEQRLWMPAETLVIHFSYTLCLLGQGWGFGVGSHTGCGLSLVESFCNKD